jgi:hypothetical protein
VAVVAVDDAGAWALPPGAARNNATTIPNAVSAEVFFMMLIVPPGLQ